MPLPIFCGNQFMPVGEDLVARGENVPIGAVLEVDFMQRSGKKAAGRVLDGRTWDEFPTQGPQ